MKRYLPLAALVAGLAAASALPRLLGTGDCTECTPFSCPPSAAPKRSVPKTNNGPEKTSEPSQSVVEISRR